LVRDSNMLYRPFSVSYWHPTPRNLLVIGLSTGAWTQVLANHPQVEKITVVEINPGYLRLIGKYPQVSSLLSSPKISISIDDGRRWLLRNPDAKFDVIVSNTTFNWRSNVSNLLSKEFLELIRRHLDPGGVFFYNLTASEEAKLTGVTVFPYGLMIGSCLAVSDSPFQLDIDRWKRVMSTYRINGVPVLDPNNREHRKELDDIAQIYTSGPREEAIRAGSKATRLVTDDNMGNEWIPLSTLLAKALQRN
jgi:spermidine synthase